MNLSISKCSSLWNIQSEMCKKRELKKVIQLFCHLKLFLSPFFSSPLIHWFCRVPTSRGCAMPEVFLKSGLDSVSNVFATKFTVKLILHDARKSGEKYEITPGPDGQDSKSESHVSGCSEFFIVRRRLEVVWLCFHHGKSLPPWQLRAHRRGPDGRRGRWGREEEGKSCPLFHRKGSVSYKAHTQTDMEAGFCHIEFSIPLKPLDASKKWRDVTCWTNVQDDDGKAVVVTLTKSVRDCD